MNNHFLICPACCWPDSRGLRPLRTRRNSHSLPMLCTAAPHWPRVTLLRRSRHCMKKIRRNDLRPPLPHPQSMFTGAIAAGKVSSVSLDGGGDERAGTASRSAGEQPHRDRRQYGPLHPPPCRPLPGPPRRAQGARQGRRPPRPGAAVAQQATRQPRARPDRFKPPAAGIAQRLARGHRSRGREDLGRVSRSRPDDGALAPPTRPRHSLAGWRPAGGCHRPRGRLAAPGNIPRRHAACNRDIDDCRRAVQVRGVRSRRGRTPESRRDGRGSERRREGPCCPAPGARTPTAGRSRAGERNARRRHRLGERTSGARSAFDSRRSGGPARAPGLRREPLRRAPHFNRPQAAARGGLGTRPAVPVGMPEHLRAGRPRPDDAHGRPGRAEEAQLPRGPVLRVGIVLAHAPAGPLLPARRSAPTAPTT